MSPSSAEFSLMVLVTLLLKKRYSWISHANLASDEGQVKFLQVL